MIKPSEVNVGDIHYEYCYGSELKVSVITEPILSNDCWRWKSKVMEGSRKGEEIDYVICNKLMHYGPKLYTYQAYGGCEND